MEDDSQTITIDRQDKCKGAAIIGQTLQGVLKPAFVGDFLLCTTQKSGKEAEEEVIYNES